MATMQRANLYSKNSLCLQKIHTFKWSLFIERGIWGILWISLRVLLTFCDENFTKIDLSHMAKEKFANYLLNYIDIVTQKQ